MKIFNRLNIDINAFVKVENGERRGAGRRNGKFISRIPKKEELEVAFDDIPTKKLILYLEMNQMPDHRQTRGVKVIAGERSGVPHHFTFLEKEDAYEALVHYDLSGKSVKERENFIKHIDPNVEHPDNPDN